MAHSPGLARTIIMVPTGILGIIHPGWVELPLARTNFHGPKPVQAIEVLQSTSNGLAHNILVLITYRLAVKINKNLCYGYSKEPSRLTDW